MRFARFILPGLLLACATTSTLAQTALDVPVHVRRLSDRAIVVSLGDFAWMNQTIALASKKGLVVIDTQMSRGAAQAVRSAIEQAFGRRDFAYVINTHHHHDHTNGNQIYAGVPIAGHDECAAGMRRDLAGIPEWLAGLSRNRIGFEEQSKTMDPQSEKAKTNREYIALLGAAVRDMETGHVPTYPTITFSDRKALDLGDMTVNLYSLPAGHTPGDIVVHVPEESLLCVGDMIAEGWLPVFDPKSPPDPDSLLPKWRRLLADAAGTRHVVMGHGFSKTLAGPDFSNVSLATLTWRYAYLQVLWDGVIKARVAGRSLDDAKADLAIERAFPQLKDKRREIRSADGALTDAHARNVEVLWEVFDRKRR